MSRGGLTLPDTNRHGDGRMKRRTVLQSAAATATVLAAPRIARADGAKVVTFAPHADLASLDAVWTTADITLNHSLAAFWENPTCVPLGMYEQPTAFPATLKDVPDAWPQFYTLRKDA